MAALTAGMDRVDAARDAGPAGPGTARSAGPAAADRSGAGAGADRSVRSWPLLVLAAPAAAEVWSGWVGIAQKTGFGLVRPLPGIWPALHLDTAITLPIGVEAYAAYALQAWLARDRAISARTRRFARWSAIFSFALGMAGQVAYHLMAQAGMTRAPWAITTIVSCLPVLVLGMGPRWRTCCAPTPRPPVRRTAGPDRQPPCGPGPGLPRTRTGTGQSAGNRRRSGTGSRSGTRMARRRGRSAAQSRDMISGLPRRRRIGPAWSPAGLPRQGNRSRGKHCAAAE
jgi:hypothetical protein